MFRRLLIGFALLCVIISLVSCGVGPFGQAPTATPTKVTKAKATKTPTPSAKTKAKVTPTVEDQATSAPAEDGNPTVAPDEEPTAAPEGGEEATSTPPPETEPAATPEGPQSAAEIGQTQQSGDYKVTINRVRRETKGKTNPDKGNEFVIVNATVENTSSHDLPVGGPLMFELQAGNGENLDHTSSANVDKGLEGLLSSGEKVTGEVAWEVPQGTKGLTVTFESILGGDKVTFNLGQ